MALSTKKKNIIIADWKTGNYKQKDMLLKHKIDRKTFLKVVEGILPSNAEAVEILHGAEMVKKSLKNPVELKAVENVVRDRLKVNNIANKFLDKLENFIDKGKAVKIVTEGQGMGVSTATQIEHDFQSSDYKNLADTIYKAGQALGVVDSGNKVEVNTQNNNNASVEIVGYRVKTIENEG